MNRKQAELLLAAVILTRSSAYIFSKTGLETLGTFNLLAARFLLSLCVPHFFDGESKRLRIH